MGGRIAMILVTIMAACGGPDKPAPVPVPDTEPPPDAAPDPEPDPPLATDTNIPKEPATGPRPAGDHTGSIRGSVTGAVSGKPLAGVTVFLSGPDGILSATTEADGSYEITGVPPGTHEVTYSYKRAEVVAEVEVAAASATVVPVAIPRSKTAPVIVH